MSRPEENDMNTILYKLLSADGRACNGGLDQWSLPQRGKPGKWMPSIKNPKLCSRGYHGVPIEYVLDWKGDTLWEMEVRGAADVSPEKTAAESARLIRRIPGWNDKNLRLFACDCAEHVLPIYLDSSPENDGMALMLAIHVAREYAHGRGDAQDVDAARSAAWAARSAAWTAQAEEKEWQINRLCEYLQTKKGT